MIYALFFILGIVVGGAGLFLYLRNALPMPPW